MRSKNLAYLIAMAAAVSLGCTHYYLFYGIKGKTWCVLLQQPTVQHHEPFEKS